MTTLPPDDRYFTYLFLLSLEGHYFAYPERPFCFYDDDGKDSSITVDGKVIASKDAPAAYEKARRARLDGICKAGLSKKMMFDGTPGYMITEAGMLYLRRWREREVFIRSTSA